MANIDFYGTWLNVPYIDLPKVGGGKARLWDGIKMGVLRKDAELVKTWAKDSLFVEDDGGTIPAYPSAATTIVISDNLTPTYTLDYANYNYYVLERALTIPIYNTSTPVKSRNEYAIFSGAYEIIEYPANTFQSLVGNKKHTSRSVSVNSAGTTYRMLYWSSASAVTVYTGSSYGLLQVIGPPTVSSGVLTAKNPALYFRGTAAYMSQAVYETITDIRVQYIIELYRVPKGSMNLDGWGLYTQADHVIDCVDSNSHTLT